MSDDLARISRAIDGLAGRYRARICELQGLVERLRPQHMTVGPIRYGEWGYSPVLLVNGNPPGMSGLPNAETMLRVLQHADDFERAVIESAGRIVRPVLEAAEQQRVRETLIARLEPEIGRDEAIVAVDGYLSKPSPAPRRTRPWWRVWER